MARRALLTEGERELIADPDEDDRRYVAVSRVRRKITEELPRDVEVLRNHHTDLLEELRAVVCIDDAPAEISESVETAPTSPAAGNEDDGPPREEPPDDDAPAPPDLDLPAPEREAVHAAYEYLQDQGVSQAKNFREDVYPDHKAGYVDGKAPARAWWKNLIQRNLREFPDVEPPQKEGGHKWYYTGDET